MKGSKEEFEGREGGLGGKGELICKEGALGGREGELGGREVGLAGIGED